jgi:hypothetical protein
MDTDMFTTMLRCSRCGRGFAWMTGDTSLKLNVSTEGRMR